MALSEVPSVDAGYEGVSIDSMRDELVDDRRERRPRSSRGNRFGSSSMSEHDAGVNKDIFLTHFLDIIRQ